MLNGFSFTLKAVSADRVTFTYADRGGRRTVSVLRRRRGGVSFPHALDETGESLSPALDAEVRRRAGEWAVLARKSRR